MLKKLQAQFNMCHTLNATNQLDVENFMDSLAGNFAGVVQYNRDNRNPRGTAGKSITIDTVCDIMTNSSRGAQEYVQRYADVNRLINSELSAKKDCQQFSYDSVIASMSSNVFRESEAGRQWTYQTCNEFGFYQTSNLIDQPFGHDFPLNFSVQICQDLFGRAFNLPYIRNAVSATNIRYGAKDIRQRRIVFINGSIDPWHALGLINQTKLFPDNDVIYIQGTAHCANMYPESEADLPQLKMARLKIAQLISHWLHQQ